MGIGKTIQKFGKWLFNIKDTVITEYPLEEELIRKENIIKKLSQQVQGQSAQLSRISAIEREKSESAKSEDYSQEIAKRLKAKEKEIKDKRFSHMFSLRFFFNKCGYEKKPTKFGKSLEITDKDDSVTFGNFGDILIADNGYFVITDSNGDILNYSKNFTELVWKPDGLVNYMKRIRIPLAVDENMNAVPDLEEEEHSDIMWDEDKNEYAETEMRKRTVKSMLIEKNEIINELQRKFERAEKIIIDMRQNLSSTKMALRILENRANMSSAELSGVVEKAMEIENKMGQSQNTIAKLTELKAHYEEKLESSENIIRNLMAKVEKYGDKSLYDLVKQEIKDDILFNKDVLPQEKIIEKDIEPKIQPAQAGGRL